MNEFAIISEKRVLMELYGPFSILLKSGAQAKLPEELLEKIRSTLFTTNMTNSRRFTAP